MDRVAAMGWFASLEGGLRADLISRGRLKRCAAGEWLHGEGDEETGLFALLDGALHLYSQAPGGREVLFSVLPAGAVMGQSVMLGGGPRLVTAIAARDSEVFLLSDRALREAAVAHPMLWRSISMLVYGQLRAAIQGWAEAVGLAPRERMVSRLLAMSADGRAVRLSQTELAELTGVTRKAVNGWLKALERRGVVALGYGRIEIKDRRALRGHLTERR